VYYWKMWVGDNFLRGLNPSSPPAMIWPSHILAWLMSEKEKLTNRETFVVTAIRYYEMSLAVEWVMRRHGFCVFKKTNYSCFNEKCKLKVGSELKNTIFLFWVLVTVLQQVERKMSRLRSWDGCFVLDVYHEAVRDSLCTVAAEIVMFKIWDHFWSTEINEFQLIISLTNVTLKYWSGCMLWSYTLWTSWRWGWVAPGNEEKLSAEIA
jgi:hypothetical protein